MFLNTAFEIHLLGSTGPPTLLLLKTAFSPEFPDAHGLQLRPFYLSPWMLMIGASPLWQPELEEVHG